MAEVLSLTNHRVFSLHLCCNGVLLRQGLEITTDHPSTLLSLLLDQCVFAPTFIAAFMSAITIAEALLGIGPSEKGEIPMQGGAVSLWQVRPGRAQAEARLAGNHQGQLGPLDPCSVHQLQVCAPQLD
eukprot:scaffold199623_cov21-Tisochrysis_lutea.AAC.1